MLVSTLNYMTFLVAGWYFPTPGHMPGSLDLQAWWQRVDGGESNVFAAAACFVP